MELSELIDGLAKLGLYPPRGRIPGPQGPAGEPGEDGAPGKSAYELWLEKGNTGSEEDFLESLQGEMGPAGGAFVQDRYTLTALQLAEKKVTLSQTPADPNNVSFVPQYGIEQWPGIDFVVVGNELSWDGLALQLLLEEGDKFAVRYLPLSSP